MQHSFIRLALVTSLLAGCGSAVQNPVSGQNERSVMSVAAEIEEGKKGHQVVMAEYGPVKDAKLQAYVNAIGQGLAKHSERADLEWHFTVLDSPQINAFALPGGYVYVTRGIMAYMESDADLAGVIGHEIGHVTARHGAQRATRQQNAGLGVLAASVLGAVLESQGLTGAAQAASQVSQGVAAGYVAKYGREQELQADSLGAAYLSRSNFDPHNMVDVINVLKNQERFAADLAKAQGKTAPAGNDWLASHPSNDERLSRITQLADQYKPKGAYLDEGRARYLQAIAGMTFGESPEQGVTRGNNFYHEGLGIAVTAPPGWKIQNAADRLTLVNPERDAGLVIRNAPAEAGKTHEEIIRKLFKPVQGRVEAAALQALPATHFIGVVQDQQGKQQGLEATIVSGPKGNNYVLAYAAKDAPTLQRARAQMRQAESSFRAITAPDLAEAKPWVVKVVPMPRGGFAELARRSPLDGAEQQLKLMNGVYAGGQIAAGQPVKVAERP